jgi:hypothetical protein
MPPISVSQFGRNANAAIARLGLAIARHPTPGNSAAATSNGDHCAVVMHVTKAEDANIHNWQGLLPATAKVRSATEIPKNDPAAKATDNGAKGNATIAVGNG